MDKKKIWKIVGNVAIIGLIVVMMLPSGRTWIQQRLMKIGLFQPKLEKVDDPAQVSETSTPVKSKYTGVSFTDDDGKIVNIPDLEGKVVFLNFWATWCPPCKAEMPSIQVLKDTFKDNDQIVFLLVEMEGEKEKAHNFMKQEGLDLPVYYPHGPIPEEWLGGAIPTTVILDKTGHMATRHEGMADYSSTEVVNFITALTEK